MNELRFAARRLRQSPGFAFTALLVLTIYSEVDAIVFQPLPFPGHDLDEVRSSKQLSFPVPQPRSAGGFT